MLVFSVRPLKKQYVHTLQSKQRSAATCATRMLSSITPEDPDSDTSAQYTTETLLPQVYDELRRLAKYRMSQQAPGQTISGTALLHEAYLRLKKEGEGPRWANRKQFFSAAGEAMRRILLDRIRSKTALKRGKEVERAELEQAEIAMPAADDELLRIDDALEILGREDPESADLVKMRFFVGFTLEEIAEAYDVSVRTVTRQWAFARSWLAEHLKANT